MYHILLSASIRSWLASTWTYSQELLDARDAWNFCGLVAFWANRAHLRFLHFELVLKLARGRLQKRTLWNDTYWVPHTWNILSIQVWCWAEPNCLHEDAHPRRERTIQFFYSTQLQVHSIFRRLAFCNPHSRQKQNFHRLFWRNSDWKIWTRCFRISKDNNLQPPRNQRYHPKHKSRFA